MGPIICAYENPIYNVVHFTLWYHIWNQSLSPSVMNNCSHMCIRGWGSGCRVSWCHTNVILFYNSSRIIAAIFISVFMSVGPLFWKGRKRFGGRFLKHFLMIPVSFIKSCQKEFLTSTFSSKIQKGHDFSSSSARTRTGNTQTKLQASQIKQIVRGIVTHVLQMFFVCQTKKKVRVQVPACYQGQRGKNNPQKSGKPQHPYTQRNSSPRKKTSSWWQHSPRASAWCVLTPPDPSSPAGRVWETLEAWSRHEVLAGASQDDHGPLGQRSLMHNLTSSVVHGQHHPLT